MPRDYKIHLEDILEAIGKILSYTDSISFKDFSSDSKTIDAVIRNLEIIGEAIKKVPEDTRKLKPEIEWKNIAALRDILIHEYFGIDNEIVWDIIRNKLPVLKDQISDLLKDLL